MDTLGARLKLARTQAGLTQTQLADKSGVAQSDISKLERGDMAKTTSLPALARALGCDIHWLDTGEGQPAFVSSVWPFPKIPLARLMALSDDDRGYVQRRLLQAIQDCEQDTSGGDISHIPASDEAVPLMSRPHNDPAGSAGRGGLAAVQPARRGVIKTPALDAEDARASRGNSDDRDTHQPAGRPKNTRGSR